MEQSSSSEQDTTMLIMGQRIAPNMINLIKLFIVKSFSLFDTCFVLGLYVKLILQGILLQTTEYQ